MHDADTCSASLLKVIPGFPYMFAGTYDYSKTIKQAVHQLANDYTAALEQVGLLANYSMCQSVLSDRTGYECNLTVLGSCVQCLYL